MGERIAQNTIDTPAYEVARMWGAIETLRNECLALRLENMELRNQIGHLTEDLDKLDDRVVSTAETNHENRLNELESDVERLLIDFDELLGVNE